MCNGSDTWIDLSCIWNNTKVLECMSCHFLLGYGADGIIIITSEGLLCPVSVYKMVSKCTMITLLYLVVGWNTGKSFCW